MFRDLIYFYQNLLLELKNYEENQKAARLDRPSGLGELDQQQMGIIPVSTSLQYIIVPTLCRKEYKFVNGISTWIMIYWIQQEGVMSNKSKVGYIVLPRMKVQLWY